MQKFGTQADKARVLMLFRNGDKRHEGERYTLNTKLVKTYDQFKQKMTTVVKPKGGVCLKVYTPQGKLVRSMDDLVDGGHYVCASAEKFDRALLSPHCSLDSPSSAGAAAAAGSAGSAAAAAAADEPEAAAEAEPEAEPEAVEEADAEGGSGAGDDGSAAAAAGGAAAGSPARKTVVSAYASGSPGKFGTQADKARVMVFYRNGDKRHEGERYTLNTKLVKTYDQLKQKLTNVVKPKGGVCLKVYTAQGKLVRSMDDLVDGGRYVCASAEKFDAVNLHPSALEE